MMQKEKWEIWRILTRALENLKNLHFNEFLLNKVHNGWAKKSIGEFCLMALKIDATFGGKLTCAFKNDMRNLANFHQSMSESLKMGLWWDPFIQGRKCMSLKFTRKFCVMKMKNDAKCEEEFNCYFKLAWGNSQILIGVLKNLKNLQFNTFLLTKVYNVWAKSSIEQLYLMALKIDAKLPLWIKLTMRQLLLILLCYFSSFLCYVGGIPVTNHFSLLLTHNYILVIQQHTRSIVIGSPKAQPIKFSGFF